MSDNLVHRFRRWVIAATAFAALLALGATVWAGLADVQGAFASFRWAYMVPVVALTLLNYGLRFAKWHYLLRRLGVDMPLRDDAWNFLAGLAMVISPGKAGELLKPYVVRARTGAPMARTLPALVTERLTDAIAVIILASFGVTTYAADQLHTLLLLGGAILGGLLILASPGLSLRLIDLLGQLPLVGRISPKLREMYSAMRTCASPVPLTLTILVSIVAWGGECLGYQLVFRGLGVDASLGVCTFLYASATILGGPSPGGLGVAEGALALGAVSLIPGTTEAQALAASLIIRVATLWLGVALGTGALFRLSGMLGGDIDLQKQDSDDTAAPSSPPAHVP